MGFSNLTYLLTCALLLQAVVGSAAPLFHFCSSQNFTTPPAPYQANLNTLLAALSIKVPPTGFASASVPAPAYPNAAYGLGLCRGDVSPSDCKTCVAEASGELRRRCPTNKGANIIWYDNCLVKYSDESFFGQIDNRNRFYMWNLRNVSDAAAFNGKVRELLSELAEEAVAAPSGRMFAAGETSGEKVYGMVQCTRDLSGSECKKCLDGVISELPSCCDAKEGGRVVGGSCNFRYEIYPFLNTY